MSRNIKLLALHNFFTDFKLYSAVLVIYFARITDSYALAMAVFSVTMATSAIAEIPTGIFSDMIGRRKTIIIGSLCALLSVIFYAVGGNFWILIIGALFEGLSRSWYSGNNNALLYDSLDDSGTADGYSHQLGKTSSLFQIALARGAFIGSILASRSFHLIMWLSVIPQLACFFISFYLTEPEHHRPDSTNIFHHLGRSVSLILKNRILRLVSLQDILSFGINEATYQFRAVFVSTLWPLWAIGISNLLSNAGAAISFWTSGRLIRKFGEARVIFYPRIYSRIVGIISYAFPTVASPVILSTTSLFFGSVTVATDSLLQKGLTKTERATAASFVSLAGSVFFVFFSVALGFIADSTGPSIALLCAEICSVSTVFVCWKLLKESHIRV
jgi:MFS family permease